jgi:hypothetical protein
MKLKQTKSSGIKSNFEGRFQSLREIEIEKAQFLLKNKNFKEKKGEMHVISDITKLD